jgi:hypothetical protein
MSPRRARRIQNELRLWLRSKYGTLQSYSKFEIDRGREVPGFSGVEDALVAYTFFGPDLVPNFMDSVAQSIPAEELKGIVDALADGAGDLADLFGDEGIS